MASNELRFYADENGVPLMVYGSSVLSAVARKKLSDRARELHASGVLKGAGKTGSKMSRQVQKSAAIAIASQALFFASAAVVKSFTLTYGNSFPSAAVSKAHLAALKKRIARAFGDDVLGFWVLEWQARGAPHYHLVVGLSPAVDPLLFDALMRDWWIAITGLGGSSAAARDDRAVWSVDVYDFGGAVAYLLTELGKSSQKIAPDAPGNWWGVIGRRAAFPAPSFELRAPLDAAACARLVQVDELLRPDVRSRYVEWLDDDVVLVRSLWFSHASRYILDGNEKDWMAITRAAKISV